MHRLAQRTRPRVVKGIHRQVILTHLSLHVRVVFSTKNRAPWIDAVWRDRLHAYLGGVAREQEAAPEAIGGVADHVHLLLGLKATHALATVLREVKKASSEWVHATIGQPEFAWQDGYGAFSVSASLREEVRGYIARQEEHHRRRTLQEEYRALLEKSGVAFDPRFVD